MRPRYRRLEVVAHLFRIATVATAATTTAPIVILVLCSLIHPSGARTASSTALTVGGGAMSPFIAAMTSYGASAL